MTLTGVLPRPTFSSIFLSLSEPQFNTYTVYIQRWNPSYPKYWKLPFFNPSYVVEILLWEISVSVISVISVKKWTSSILVSGRFGDPFGRPGDLVYIKKSENSWEIWESWHQWYIYKNPVTLVNSSYHPFFYLHVSFHIFLFCS